MGNRELILVKDEGECRTLEGYFIKVRCAILFKTAFL